ncbi:alkyl sulfatase dimerization domain-containing protein [Sabulicella glaciei]|uniref:Alkyl sulfatase dimerisation domain-containing protein n=1 Tax=Sabulicella glaciei TaxID=2984948 RepID=A0ABT3NZH5_9PROT|nr:alkyl sulfatase dimerization domain-containing protein [Roseococcus sp. MDT2-1-1]MCW8087567.1 hypothetical protein [Roseococcus sp. MDT2-1-1]
MGGAAQVIERTRGDFERGEYRWVAQVMNQVVFAQPENGEARELAADALGQMGYQAGSATWRNAYILGAQELRHGIKRGARTAVTRPGLMPALSTDVVFDYMAARLNSSKTAGQSWRIAWHFEDLGEHFAMTLENATLTHLPGRTAGRPDVAVTTSRTTLDGVMTGTSSMGDAITKGEATATGTLPSLRSFSRCRTTSSPCLTSSNREDPHDAGTPHAGSPCPRDRRIPEFSAAVQTR